MRAAIWLAMVLLFLSVNANANCEAKSATQVITILQRGVELNERFKKSVNANDEAGYRTLRAQVETYDETRALPCVRRALSILSQRSDDKLLRSLMEFTISHDNSADESMSDAMATLYVKRPKDIEATLPHFSSSQRAILLNCVDAGWAGATKALGASKRQSLRKRLNRLREMADNRKLDVRQ